MIRTVGSELPIVKAAALKASKVLPDEGALIVLPWNHH